MKKNQSLSKLGHSFVLFQSMKEKEQFSKEKTNIAKKANKKKIWMQRIYTPVTRAFCIFYDL